MNSTVLQKYSLEMWKTGKKFDGYVAGNPIAAYIYNFRHPEDVDDFISDINLAINGNFQQIEDPEYGGGLGSYWHAWITPDHFELWQTGFAKDIIPLTDWKEILLSWKECLEDFKNTLLNKYGIAFEKSANGDFRTTACSKNLDSFMYMFCRHQKELEKFVFTTDTVLKGNYDLIPYDSREWSQEMGLQIYTGIIQDDLTFDLFLEDHYDQTKETFPLSDIKEIFQSLLEFIS